MSALTTVIGAVLPLAGFRRRVTPAIKWPGIAGAAGLAGIDLYYALSDMIREVYLLDAAGETVLILRLLWGGAKGPVREHE